MSKEILEDDGLFIVFTPFTWMKQWADVDKWLGGHRVNAEIVCSLNGLAKKCAP